MKNTFRSLPTNSIISSASRHTVTHLKLERSKDQIMDSSSLLKKTDSICLKFRFFLRINGMDTDPSGFNFNSFLFPDTSHM